MDWKVPLADIDFNIEEETAVMDVIRGRWLTMGKITQEFEEAFASYLGVKYALAVSNATVALHLACEALGIGPGDEVIVPSLSFVATSNSVLYTGAEIRFADIQNLENLTISPDSIEDQITPRTKSIIVMHYGGYPCQMPIIMEIAKKYNLTVIEDAAHAPGASLNEKALGTFGDVGCFSFFSNKNLSTGEGGMLVTNRDDIAEKVRVMRSHGMTSLTWDRHQGHAYSYDVTELGYNYRIDEIRSALGKVQLKKLRQNNARRKEFSEQYISLLKDSEVAIPFLDYEGDSAYHIFPILLPENIERLDFIDKLRSAGIQTSIHYPPIHQFQYYHQRYKKFDLPLTESAAERELTLPLYPGMTDEIVNYVAINVKETISCARANTI